MGVLEFFGTLIKNEITSTSIKSNFQSQLDIDHLLLDFNSIIHVSGVKVTEDINSLLQTVLKDLYSHHPVTHLTGQFQKYKMEMITSKDPNVVVKKFQDHFTEKLLDKLVITLVINTVLSIIKTFCYNKTIKTLLLAIDGVPSKGKMIEQKQRRYLGAVTAEYEKMILDEYTDYLLEQPDYVYLLASDSIKWNRNKITPGTDFMDKLVKYLKSDKIQEKFRTNRAQMKVIVSDMYEVGEGEKKIVNYLKHYFTDAEDKIMVYSPDADMILLCILLPLQNVFILRHNPQVSATEGTNIYDLIDINLFKGNISYYINTNSKTQFDINRINNDLVCISTLFGNDFVPKIETLNVKKGFQNIMDAYMKTLMHYKDKGYYLVKNGGKHRLNFVFLKHVLKELLPEENDFIKHNELYAQYITVGQIKNVFDYMEINFENIVSTYNNFRKEYETLKHAIRTRGELLYFETHDQFMRSLKKSLLVIIDDQPVNTTYLSNKEMISVLQKYFRKYNDFPRLNINLNSYSHSITDVYHQRSIKDKKLNDYQKELYKFRKMLDDYYIKFNAQPLSLKPDEIPAYYENNFGVELYRKKELTKEAKQVMHDYIEGLLWVFNYYYNDMSYINTWSYVHERAPLLRHLLMFLESIDLEYFNSMLDNLDVYQVSDLKSYFNPVEQLIYVSPMTPEVLKLLPPNYYQYISSDNLDPFLKNYFVDIHGITKKLWKESVSTDVDCRGIMFFNKCFLKSISRPTMSDDKQFLKAIRKVKPDEISIQRSRNALTKY